MDPTGEFAIAIPIVVIGAEELGKTFVVAVCTVIAYHAVKETSKTIPQAITNSKTNDKQSENFVYHSTTFQPFVEKLMSVGNSAIDKSKTNPDCRFGQQFYVASDKMTAYLEAGGVSTLVKFKMAENAKVLDLTNSEIANKYEYTKGLSREDARNLMGTWNLAGIDAIKFPSEKNPGGTNYAVLNPSILTPVGVE